jgi:hypothetical protein
MAAINALSLYFTWKAFGFDGFECVGWPFVFFERGGFSYQVNFYPLPFAVDFSIAFGVAYISAQGTRNGWVPLIHWLRYYGIDPAEHENPAGQSSGLGSRNKGD